jgi:hypothetical protein
MLLRKPFTGGLHKCGIRKELSGAGGCWSLGMGGLLPLP